MTVDREADMESLRTSCLSFISTGSAETTETLSPDHADDPPPYSPLEQSYPVTSKNHPSVSELNPAVSLDSSTANDARRTLLLVYIHGFMGNETSFQNFPADVHNLLAALLFQTHSVHTKIYPRYRSKKAIQVATNDFSKWLAPHESSTTDVVLLGHSLGGILAAEVALLPTEDPHAKQPLRHNILGTLSFDTPFLGMHPGVIKSGLGSIFNPSPTPLTQQQNHDSSENVSIDRQSMGGIAGLTTMLFASSQLDPNYNPAFPNDVRLPVRSGWANALHFVQKHSKDLRQATTQLVASHLEFGGCLADADGLKTRYVRIRMLEEEADGKRKAVLAGSQVPHRVRFANYYTASTGRIKAVKAQANGPSIAESASKDDCIHQKENGDLMTNAAEATHKLDMDEVTLRDSEDDCISGEGLRNLDPLPEVDWDDEVEFDDLTPDISISDSTSSHSTLTPIPSIALNLPGLPNIPTPPIRLSSNKTTYVRMLVDYERDLKNYRQALKIYRKTHVRVSKEDRKSSNSPEVVKQQQLQADLDRSERDVEACEEKVAHLLAKAERKSEKSKLKTEKKIEKVERKMAKDVDKAERKAEKDREKAEKKATKEAEKSERKLVKEAEKRTKKIDSWSNPDSQPNLASISSTTSSQTLVEDQTPSISSKKPPKDRKFCILPPKDPRGNRDPCWVRVYMQGVDEVGAHCGLFFPWQPGEISEGMDGSKGSSERYARLVSGVCEKIEEWVGESATLRALQEEA